MVELYTDIDVDQLLEKWAALLQKDELSKFDKMVIEARNRIRFEAEQKQLELEKLFDIQIATFKAFDVPEQIIKIFLGMKGEVIGKASGMTIGKGNNPFLPVIKPMYLGYYGLMAMVRNGGKAGYICLDVAEIADVVDTPQGQGFYYIYDVDEDGLNTRGKSPENAENILKQQKRSPLTAAEAIALTTHTDVLSRHYVWATGSRYKSADRVPFVYLDCGDRPELCWVYVDFSLDPWGTASCGS